MSMFICAIAAGSGTDGSMPKHTLSAITHVVEKAARMALSPQSTRHHVVVGGRRPV